MDIFDGYNVSVPILMVTAWPFNLSFWILFRVLETKRRSYAVCKPNLRMLVISPPDFKCGDLAYFQVLCEVVQLPGRCGPG